MKSNQLQTQYNLPDQSQLFVFLFVTFLLSTNLRKSSETTFGPPATPSWQIPWDDYAAASTKCRPAPALPSSHSCATKLQHWHHLVQEPLMAWTSIIIWGHVNRPGKPMIEQTGTLITQHLQHLVQEQVTACTSTNTSSPLWYTPG